MANKHGSKREMPQFFQNKTEVHQATRGHQTWTRIEKDVFSVDEVREVEGKSQFKMGLDIRQQ